MASHQPPFRQVGPAVQHHRDHPRHEERHAKHATGLVHRPAEPVDLDGLGDVLGPVGKNDAQKPAEPLLLAWFEIVTETLRTANGCAMTPPALPWRNGCLDHW